LAAFVITSSLARRLIARYVYAVAVFFLCFEFEKLRKDVGNVFSITDVKRKQ
jgi:hypothetical protein